MEGYRSGHNGAVLKTVCGQPRKGSNPLPSVPTEASKRQRLLAFVFPVKILLELLLPEYCHDL